MVVHSIFITAVLMIEIALYNRRGRNLKVEFFAEAEEADVGGFFYHDVGRVALPRWSLVVRDILWLDRLTYRERDNVRMRRCERGKEW